MVICLERDADLHIAQLMPLPLTVSCFSKILIGITFLVPAHLGSPGKRAVKRVCVCVCVWAHAVVCPLQNRPTLLVHLQDAVIVSRLIARSTTVPLRPTATIEH